MVQRNAQSVNFGGGQSAQVQQSGSGMKQVDVAAYSDPAQHEAIDNTGSASTRLLDRLVGITAKLTEQGYDQAKEEAMLAGAAHAASRQSEASMETNFFTRAWATAGFRDTAGRMAMADQGAQIATDMHENKSLSADKFAEYLAGKRSELMPTLEGMSLQGRKAAFQQMALDEKSAISAHGAAHYKYIIDTENRSIQVGWSRSRIAMDSARQIEGSPDDPTKPYRDSVDSAIGMLNSGLVNNAKLVNEPGVVAKQMYSAMSDALENNHTALYERARDTLVTGPDGQPSSMFESMTTDEKVKLNESYLKSLGRTAALRNNAVIQQEEVYKANFADMTKDLPSHAELEAFVLNNSKGDGAFYHGDKAAGLWTAYDKALVARRGYAEFAPAVLSGNDANVAAKYGKTTGDLFEAYTQSQEYRQMTGPQRRDALFMLTGKGNPHAAKAYQNEIMPVINAVAMSKEGKTDPAQAQALAGELARMFLSDTAGDRVARRMITDGMTPEASSFMEDLVYATQTGKATGQAAISMAQERTITRANTDKQLLVANTTKATDAVGALLDELSPKGMFGMAWLKTKAFMPWHGEADVVNKVAQYNDGSVVPDIITQSAKTRLMELATDVIKEDSSRGAGAVLRMAQNRFDALVFRTDNGPVVLPKGTTPQAYFGLEANVGTERIQSALSEMVKPTTPKGRVVFATGPRGEFLVGESNSTGGFTTPMHEIDPKGLQAVVTKQDREQAAKAQTESGAGKTVQGLWYNGRNTASVQPSVMLEARDALIKFEGAGKGATPYEVADAVNPSVKHTLIGPGILLKNGNTGAGEPLPKNPDGTYNQKSVNEAFQRATDKAGSRATAILGTFRNPTVVNSMGTWKALMDLSYHGMHSTESGYQPMLKGLALGNKEATLAGLRGLRAYQQSGPERRAYLEQNILSTIK